MAMAPAGPAPMTATLLMGFFGSCCLDILLVCGCLPPAYFKTDKKTEDEYERTEAENNPV